MTTKNALSEKGRKLEIWKEEKPKRKIYIKEEKQTVLRFMKKKKRKKERKGKIRMN